MAWTKVCNQLNGQTHIPCLAVYGGRLYGGTRPNGRLFRLNVAGNAWEQVCDQLDDNVFINRLMVASDGRLYASTTSPTAGKLLRLNLAGNAWEQVATAYLGVPLPQYFSSLIEHDGRILVGGRRQHLGQVDSGFLLRLKLDESGWDLVAVTDSEVSSLEHFNGRLWVGTNWTSQDGFRWIRRLNLPENALEDMVNLGTVYVAGAYIFHLKTFNNRLYLCREGTGYLLRLDLAETGVENVGASTPGLRTIEVIGGVLYNDSGGGLYQLEADESTVTKICDPLGGQVMWSLCEYNGKVYGGTTTSGFLYVYPNTSQSASESASISESSSESASPSPPPIYTRIDVEIKNAMIYCKSANVDFSPPDSDITLVGMGITVKTPGTFRTYSEPIDAISSLKDSVIKATQLSDA